MTDTVDPGRRSEIMRKIRAKDTKLEKLVRSEMWGRGYRYRKNLGGLPGKPDMVFSTMKTVVFIDSCFWHGCPKHLRMPKSNVDYWNNKIKRNKERDDATNREYKNSGWQVVRIWEHDVKTSLETTIRKLGRIIDSRRVKVDLQKTES